MNEMLQEPVSSKNKIKQFLVHIKDLHGEPRYIAMGMAIGVFVSITPTIPFHTIIAIGLAFILKGSKPAAIIGVWFSNPITIPIFYYGCFKVGTLFLSEPVPYDIRFESIKELFSLGLNVTLAMLVGGLLLGIIPGLLTYVITYRCIAKLRERARLRKKTGNLPGPGTSGEKT